MQCLSFKIKGHVQGVFYRAAAQKKAEELGLTGFARNEMDGTVFVVACGAPESLTVFEEWLWEGSLGSDVTGVIKSPSQLGPFDDFRVIR
jgi:acylphosphatase